VATGAVALQIGAQRRSNFSVSVFQRRLPEVSLDSLARFGKHS
jgi:hypothetical protein